MPWPFMNFSSSSPNVIDDAGSGDESAATPEGAVSLVDAPRAAGPLLRNVNLVVFLVSLLVIAAAVLYFAAQPRLRWTLDATNTRAYSLSDQTLRLLDDLDGDWTITLLLVEDDLAAEERQQIDEVLSRYTRAAPNITIDTIDPTDPASIPQYEALLARLRQLYEEPLAQYETAIEGGIQTYESLIEFSTKHIANWSTLVEQLPADRPGRDRLQQYVGLFDIMAREGQQIVVEVNKARRVSDAQPIADVDAARSILATALSQWADTCNNVAITLERIIDTSPELAEIMPFLRTQVGECDAMAEQLIAGADRMVQLPELELSTIGRKLSEGEAAIVIGPDRATVIPRSQLLPRVARLGSASFDRRFRGEQLISATIRSLLIDRMPMVVFMHGEAQSLLRNADNQVDLVGVATSLAVSRFDVREWPVAQGGSPPVPEEGQDVVWVVVPPVANTIETSPEERMLIDRSIDLIRRGESVLVSFKPSFLPRYHQVDPWSRVADELGLVVETQHTIYEQFDAGESGSSISPGQVLHTFIEDHPICAAVHGQQTYFFQPVPMTWSGANTATSPWTHQAVAVVDPNGRRWVEDDLMSQLDDITPPTDDEWMRDPVTIAAVMERDDEAEGGRQRAVVVGSGGWMFSRFADSVESVGAGQAALVNPGNQELFIATIAWLGGIDDMIAPSPISQQVARLDGINSTVWVSWFLLIGLGIPLGWLMLGGGIWFIRRL